MVDIEQAAQISGKRGIRRHWSLTASFVVGQLITLAVTLGPLIGLPWWRGPRQYFSNDQLSYLAIADNVARGNFALVEPFTQTGNLHYPSLWYQTVGLVAFITGQPVWVVGQVLGMLLIGAAVATVGWVGWRLSTRVWAPVVPAALLLVGTLSTITAGYWYTLLNVHAVVWGPFGTLFVLNAEAIGVSIGAVAVALLLFVQFDAMRGRPHPALVLVVALLAGSLANIQTYSFFTTTALLAGWLAVRALIAYPSRSRTAATAGAVVAVLILGRALASAVGPLPTFGLLVAAGLLPATWPWIRANLSKALSIAVIYAVAAAPQVIHTLSGLLSDDPFLTYRQASTNALGVPLATGLVAATPLILFGIACALGLRGATNTPARSLLVATVIVVPILVFNDVWGFNQEPYRFWIQSAIILSFAFGALLPRALAETDVLGNGRRLALIAVGALAVAVAVASLGDVVGFFGYAREQGVIDLRDERATAIATITKGMSGLTAAGPCVDPQQLNLLTAAPVAFYNNGMAWPANRDAFTTLQDPSRGADAPALRAAGVQWVVLDTACEKTWVFTPAEQITDVASVPYSTGERTGEITLLRVL